MRQQNPNATRNFTIQTIYSFLIASLFCLFVAGFVAGEDAMGGGVRNDLYFYHGPTMFAFREQPWLTVLKDYSSATTPLFQIIESFNPLLGHDTAFRAVNVLLAVFLVVCFVVALGKRFPEERNIRWPIVLIGASMLLSPYFRAEAYWASTDILPMVFLVASSMFLIPMQDSIATENKTRPFFVIVIVAFLTWGAFYCRQIYLFAPIYAFVLLFFTFKKARWFSLSIFAILALPAVYLLILWKGFTPPRFQFHEKLSQNGIITPLSIIFIYSIPFLTEALIAGWKRSAAISMIVKNYGVYLLAGWLIFLAIFGGYRFNEKNQGGGVAGKLLSQHGMVGTFLYLTLSFLGLLVITWLMRQSTWLGRLLIALFLLPTFVMFLFFGRYYDPLLVVLFFLFAERQVVRRFINVRIAFLLMAFNGLLLAGALVYYGRDKPVFLPLNSVTHPWDGTPLAGRVH